MNGLLPELIILEILEPRAQRTFKAKPVSLKSTRLPKKGLVSPGLKNGFSKHEAEHERAVRQWFIDAKLDTRRALRWRTPRLSSCGGAPMPA
jgi:hypothetical protein